MSTLGAEGLLDDPELSMPGIDFDVELGRPEVLADGARLGLLVDSADLVEVPLVEEKVEQPVVSTGQKTREGSLRTQLPGSFSPIRYY